MTDTGADADSAGVEADNVVLREAAQTASATICLDDEDDADSLSGTTQIGDGMAVGRFRRNRALVCGLLAGVMLALTIGAGYLKWLGSSMRASQQSAVESVRAATDSTVALLTYTPDSVEKDLGAARQRLTGRFRDSYSALTRDVIVPGAKQKQVSAVASVRAAASMSASPNHAVVLLFVNQTVNVGNDPPSTTASTVRVTLDRVDGRWLISQYEPL